jgi:gluconokinase
MVLSTRSSTADSFIVSLDVGSSSIRALLFDAEARQMEGYGARLPYRLRTTPDGGAEVNPEALAELAIDCLDELHRQVHAAGLRVGAVIASAFWHSLLGVGKNGRPTLPVFHLLDTRSATEVARVPDAQARTGCVPHSSYWPARLLWLRNSRPAEFAATIRWLSFPEFLFEKLFGRPGCSTSMASGSGLWNPNTNDYDAETLAAVSVDRAQLAVPADMDQAACELLPEYRELWPAFEGVPWYPALGDGACNSLGSGCTIPRRFALMVGTTGAMRVVIEAPHVKIPPGVWCYRVDRKRFVVGGAVSNGGEVFSWMKRTLALPKDLEARLEASSPGGHGLMVLPFLAGERSPHWRADARAAIVGMTLATEPFDILRAALESVTLRFREIYESLLKTLPVPSEVIASGGALLHSPGWTQMMADALARPVVACTEPEASARGAALWALERIGTIPHVGALPASTGAVFASRPEHKSAYDGMLGEQRAWCEKLFGTTA